MTRKRVIWSLSALLGCLVALHLTRLEGIDGVVYQLLATDRYETIFAPGFSDGAFRRIVVGLTKQQVYEALGRPLVVYPIYGAGKEREQWWYSKPKSGRSFHLRTVDFREGRVVGKHAEFYLG